MNTLHLVISPHRLKRGRHAVLVAHHGVTKEEDRKGGVLHFEPLHMLYHVMSVRLNCVDVDAVSLTEAMANYTPHTDTHTSVVTLSYMMQ